MRIIIHAAATPPEMDIGADEIDQWHKARGWSGIGYHYVIRRNGKIERGRSVIPFKQGAHVSGHNRDSIGICLVGGKGSNEADQLRDHFTAEQELALRSLLGSLRMVGDISSIHGHNEFAAKACPGFNVAAWLAE